MLDAGSADEPRLFRSDRVEGQIDDHARDDDRNRERLAERPEDQGTTTEARIAVSVDVNSPGPPLDVSADDAGFYEGHRVSVVDAFRARVPPERESQERDGLTMEPTPRP